MVTYVSLSRICDLATHRGHKRLEIIDNIEVWFCEKIQGLRLHGRSDSVESIKIVAEAARNVAPKVENEEEGKRNFVFQNAIYEEAYRVSRTKRGTGMHWSTVDNWLKWIIRATETLAQMGYPLAVNGVLKLTGKLGPYEAYARLRDIAGDPPIIETMFTCPICNTPWDLSQLTSGTTFACTECGSWFSYTFDGDVEKINPPLNTATIRGIVVDSASGKGLAGTNLYFNKRLVATNEHGSFLYPHVPLGRYKIKVTNPAYETANLEADVHESRVHNLGSIRLFSRVPRYMALTAIPAVAGGITGGLATRNPLGAAAGSIIGGLIGLILNIFVDIASAAPTPVQEQLRKSGCPVCGKDLGFTKLGMDVKCPACGFVSAWNRGILCDDF